MKYIPDCDDYCIPPFFTTLLERTLTHLCCGLGAFLVSLVQTGSRFFAQWNELRNRRDQFNETSE